MIILNIFMFLFLLFDGYYDDNIVTKIFKYMNTSIFTFLIVDFYITASMIPVLKIYIKYFLQQSILSIFPSYVFKCNTFLGTGNGKIDLIKNVEYIPTIHFEDEEERKLKIEDIKKSKNFYHEKLDVQYYYLHDSYFIIDYNKVYNISDINYFKNIETIEEILDYMIIKKDIRCSLLHKLSKIEKIIYKLKYNEMNNISFINEEVSNEQKELFIARTFISFIMFFSTIFVPIIVLYVINGNQYSSIPDELTSKQKELVVLMVFSGIIFITSMYVSSKNMKRNNHLYVVN